MWLMNMIHLLLSLVNERRVGFPKRTIFPDPAITGLRYLDHIAANQSRALTDYVIEDSTLPFGIPGGMDVPHFQLDLIS